MDSLEKFAADDVSFRLFAVEAIDEYMRANASGLGQIEHDRPMIRSSSQVPFYSRLIIDAFEEALHTIRYGTIIGRAHSYASKTLNKFVTLIADGVGPCNSHPIIILHN
jgi:hypothetical protein